MGINARNTVGFTTKLWPILLLLTLPAVANAQFTFTTNNGAITITGYTGPGGAVVIPSTTNGYPVTEIGNASLTNPSITSVTIPESVTVIATSAFIDCTNLTSVIIPDSITNIGDYAFYLCSSLTSVTIPNSLPSIGYEVFYSCSSLTNITIGNGATSIGNWAFEYCTRLTRVTIGNNVTNIGDGAFEHCTNLSTVTLPASLNNIQIAAFGFCPSLTGVYFKGNAPSAYTTSFDYMNHVTVYYLPGTTGWSTLFYGLRAVLWNPQAEKDASFAVQTNRFGFNITGSSNLVIVVEACTNLSNPIWLPVSTNTLNTFIGTNGMSFFSDPQWTNYSSRFYRFSSP